MTATRDLVEAAAFERRRRVQAFVSGDPAPRMEDLPRPLRALVVGGVIALLVCGAEVARQFI
jgi:hypothetical protein